MLRLALVLALISCDKGPIQEHRIHYEEQAPAVPARHIDVDLDRRTLVSTDGVVTHELSKADVAMLRDLASCARDEAPGADFEVPIGLEKLVLDGDKRHEIAHGGPMTAPCASRLVKGLEVLAGW
jgi:hypothetical protein